MFEAVQISIAKETSVQGDTQDGYTKGVSDKVLSETFRIPHVEAEWTSYITLQLNQKDINSSLS